MRDHNSPTKTLGAIYMAFLKDLANHHGVSFDCEVERVQHILSSSGCKGLLSFLEKHASVLNDRLRTGVICLDNVKHDKDGYPVFLNALWRLDSVVAYADLYQALQMLKKYGDVAVENSTSLEDFQSRMLTGSAFNPRLVEMISEQLPHLIGEEDLALDHLFPLISSGARREKVAVLDRLTAVQYVGYSHNLRNEFTIVQDKAENRAIEVPKQWNKNRLVFAESSARMNSQQAVRLWLEARVSQSSEKRIDFNDQEHQRESLRCIGRGSVDLSDASDHLDRRVIWIFFKKYPVLRSALFKSRSQSTMINDHRVPLRCFGTMGNATTFTVMSIFLACLTRLAEMSHFESTRRNPRLSTVFGDDIVADVEVCNLVLPLLRAVGLQPNPRKTFVGSAFRESCGLDLFREEDITPVRVRHTRILCAKDVIRNIELSNSLHKRGYWGTAAAITRLTRPSFSVNVDECSLYSFSSGVFYSACIWNRRYQRMVSSYSPRNTSETREADRQIDLTYALCHGSRIREMVLRRTRKR